MCTTLPGTVSCRVCILPAGVCTPLCVCVLCTHTHDFYLGEDKKSTAFDNFSMCVCFSVVLDSAEEMEVLVPVA